MFSTLGQVKNARSLFYFQRKPVYRRKIYISETSEKSSSGTKVGKRGQKRIGKRMCGPAKGIKYDKYIGDDDSTVLA